MKNILIKTALTTVLATAAFTSTSFANDSSTNNPDVSNRTSGSYTVPIVLHNDFPYDGEMNTLYIPVKEVNKIGSADIIADKEMVQTKFGLAYKIAPHETIRFTAMFNKSATVECKFNLMDNKYCDVNIFDSKLPKDGAVVAFKVYNSHYSDGNKGYKGVFTAGVTPGGSIIAGLYRYDESGYIYTVNEKRLSDPIFTSTYSNVELTYDGNGLLPPAMTKHYFNVRYK